MFKKYTLKKQFVLTFIVVIISSMLAVIGTVTALWIVAGVIDYKEANYYEQMLPKIEEYIAKYNIELLDESYEKELNKIIPIDGIKYKVIDLRSNYSFGTMDWDDSRNSKLIYELNKSNVDKYNNVEKFIPIINENNDVKGVIILAYQLKVTGSGMSKLFISIALIIAIISPFIYIIIFSYIYGIRLSKNINEPLQKIKMASTKVQNRDLDFQLDYPYNNELGEVIESFNNMKIALKTTLEEQWNMEEERKEIIAGLSHDLRSPLTVIKGKVDLLLEAGCNNVERTSKYLESINNSTERAIVLVEDLNTVNKMDKPEFVITITKNNIQNFLCEKLENLIVIASSKDIEIKLHKYNIKDDSYWFFDREAISRVLDNVVINGIRHSNRNGEINIKVILKDSELIFIIDDSGKGFTNEALKKGLKKFYRGDKARSTKDGNLGLGLYISNKLVEMHKGDLRISNNRNGSGRVKFNLIGR